MVIVPLGALSLQVRRSASRREFVEQLIRELQRAVQKVVARCLEEVLEAEVTALLQREWYVRRRRGERQQPGRARCRRCGSRNVQDFRRNGHYPRHLDTLWGRLRIQVPQVECICGGTVEIPFQTLRQRQRLWDDVDGEIRQRYGWGMSLRGIKEVLDAALSSSLSLRTLNCRVRQLAGVLPGWSSQPLADVPPVVRLDGLWVTVMQPTGQQKIDRLGRQRAVKSGRDVPILVAQGVWPATGRQEIVAWVVGRAEGEESWEALLTQMEERGIVPERGLQLLIGDGSSGLEEARQTVYWDVPFQRCVFHKLRNLWRDLVLPEGLEGPAARNDKRRFIQSAARVWQAPNAEAARQRQQRFCERWAQEQPLAVATMRREFEATLTFYAVQAAAALRGEIWPAHQLRTTSHLERAFRTLRRRLAEAVLFHSPEGLDATFHQALTRCAFQRAGAPPLAWQRHLEHALAEAADIS